ncbi:hypothetical protein ACI2KR_07185 [Pseudomonas luteola]
MKRIKGISAALLLTMSLGTASPSYASGIPMVDISNLAENIAANIQSAYQWAEEKMISLSQMDLQSMLSKFEIDSMNNAMSNVIVRVNKALEDVYNQKVVEMSRPDRDACKTLAVRLTMDEILCAIDDQRSSASSSRMAAMKANTSSSASPAAHTEYVATKVTEIHNSCMKYAVGDGKNILQTECARIENVTAGPTANDSADNRKKVRVASEEAIKIMTNQQSPRKTTSPLLPDTTVTRASMANDLRFQNYKDLATYSLEEVNRMIQAAPGMESEPTPLETLKKFDADHWGSSDWMQEISNTSADKLENPVSETELLRKMTVMNAFNVHMDVLQYEHQLRMERLAAANLDLSLDPIEKDQ